VVIGLGSDWSPSGSKNLLGELKVAWLYSQLELGARFSARDLVAMATRDAARILKWDGTLGSLEAGKRADLLLIAGAAADPYEALIRARETDIHLVMINGVARYGTPQLMDQLAPRDQTVKVGGQMRRLFLKQETSDPDVAQVSLATAADALREALRNLVRLASEMSRAKPPRAPGPLDAQAHPVWSLALDEIWSGGIELSPRLPFAGPRDFTGPDRAPRVTALGAAPLSDILKPVRLDPLTVADDGNFLDSIAQQANVPAAIRQGLAGLY
jgi:hypothetical protein